MLDDERNLVVFSASPAAPPSQAPLIRHRCSAPVVGWENVVGRCGAVSRPRNGRLGSMRCTCCRCYLPTSRLCSCAGKNQSRLGRPSVFDVRGGLGVAWRPSVASCLAPWVVANFPLESHHPSGVPDRQCCIRQWWSRKYLRVFPLEPFRLFECCPRKVVSARCPCL